MYIYHVLTEALYEKKQSVVTYDAEFAKLQAQMEKLESISAEKDSCIAEYEAIAKGSEGKVIRCTMGSYPQSGMKFYKHTVHMYLLGTCTFCSIWFRHVFIGSNCPGISRTVPNV